MDMQDQQQGCFLKAIRHGVTVVFPALLIMLFSQCEKPVLTALTPDCGPPGTVVEISGDHLELATVLWNAASALEQPVPGGFFRANYFSVPPDAAPGHYPVRLMTGGEYSDAILNFHVTEGLIRPAPRLDDITISLFDIDPDGLASAILMAHGANLDAGATVLVDGNASPTFFYHLLRNTAMNCADPSTLGYPIPHYASLVFATDSLIPGDFIEITVQNLDDSLSNTMIFSIPSVMDELDSDDDGLPDAWEKDGYDADGDGVVDIDLPALGASPYRKDIFIEIDWMAEAEPNHAIWPAIESAFANAPVLNPDGSHGIAIHIDRGAGTGGGGGSIIPFADVISFGELTPPPGYTGINFYTAKAAHFDARRLNIYRYCIFAWNNGFMIGSGGWAEGQLCNDMIVSVGSWADGCREDFQTGIFLHELGHSLDLNHGGFEYANRKDNYNSVMNYGNEAVLVDGEYVKYSPSDVAGIDTDCFLDDIDGVYTYSQGMRKILNEQHLNEFTGLCDGIERDWNGNGVIESDVRFNLDTNPAFINIRDHADWGNIELNFRKTGSAWGGD